MSYAQDIQIQLSLSPKPGRGMDTLFAEHLVKHVLQFALLVRRECCNPLFQADLVNCPYLVGDNLSVASLYSAGNAEGIAVNGRCDRNDDNSSKIAIEFLRAYHYTGTDFLHLCADSR